MTQCLIIMFACYLDLPESTISTLAIHCRSTKLGDIKWLNIYLIMWRANTCDQIFNTTFHIYILCSSRTVLYYILVCQVILRPLPCSPQKFSPPQYIVKYAYTCIEISLNTLRNALNQIWDLKLFLTTCLHVLSKVDNIGSTMILRLPPFARTDEFAEAGRGCTPHFTPFSFLLLVNSSNVKLRSSNEDDDSAGMTATGKDYRRLLSETKRLLLMSPTYSLTLTQIVEHFVANGDPICSSTTELSHILTSTQNNFMVWISPILGYSCTLKIFVGVNFV